LLLSPFGILKTKGELVMKKKIRGVNLGGWLVLEKWMTPSLFEGLKAEDETRFCEELGSKAEKILRDHWNSFITEEDFQWIQQAGLNTVRIPVGHWIFGDVPPYFGSIDKLDWAMEMAKKYNLDVLLDLHAAPGCQNGFDNGGIAGMMEWHLHEENIEKSIAFIGRISERYAGHSHLMGIQLLNEPRWDVPMDIIKDYYVRAYHEARKYLAPEQAVVLHDGFRREEWNGYKEEHELENTILDTHIYHCFTEEDSNRNMFEHLHEVVNGDQAAVERVHDQIPLIVGEWSLGIPPSSLEDLNALQKELAMRAYASSQLMAFEQGAGWFFWSYKLEEGIMPGWNYRKCVENGWFPAKLI
jgi:glucan 1,3-beta-glucosidase